MQKKTYVFNLIKKTSKETLMAKRKAKAKPEFPNLAALAKIPRSMNGAWYPAEEHLPDNGKFVIGYSDIYGSYHICVFYAHKGWVDLADGANYKAITHWLDMDIPFPFENRNEYCEESAKKYGIKSRRSVFG